MNTLLRRREMMSANPLPYTPVEYIETDGAAYIDTGIKGNSPLSAEFKVTPVVDTVTRYTFGSYLSSSARLSPLYLFADKKAGFSYNGGMYNPIDITASIDNHTPMDVRVALYNGGQIFEVKQQGESSYNTFTRTYAENCTTGVNLYLFCQNNNGSPSGRVQGVRFHRTKLYDDATRSHLIWDGVPCYYNGEYGMWDLVNGTFHGNAAGSGAFTGPQI